MQHTILCNAFFPVSSLVRQLYEDLPVIFIESTQFSWSKKE
jgi:hypothetical protein